MHRQPLLRQLNTYLQQHPAESTTTHRFIQFVESHPDCFERSLSVGHITGSAWILHPTLPQTLLTHHAKLNAWLQLGGHADGDSDVLAVALKEAEEESGITGFTVLETEIFDLDIHEIPARGHEPAHLHYDVRYLLSPTHSTGFTVSAESHDLRWVTAGELPELTTDPSMLRMLHKWLLRTSTRTTS